MTYKLLLGHLILKILKCFYINQEYKIKGEIIILRLLMHLSLYQIEKLNYQDVNSKRSKQIKHKNLGLLLQQAMLLHSWADVELYLKTFGLQIYIYANLSV